METKACKKQAFGRKSLALSALPKERRKRLGRQALALAALLVAGALLYLFIGRPLVALAGDAAKFRAFVAGRGVVGRLAFLGMMILQVVVAVIPGEPFEIAAGYAFGALEGTGLCMLGTLIGGTAVFLAVRKAGPPLVAALFPAGRIARSPLLSNPERLKMLAFLLFFLPGTPKDLLTYCAGLTKINLRFWLLLTTLARFPSIVTSTIGGDALGLGDYGFAALAFGVTLLISLAGLMFYRRRERGAAGKQE